MARDANGEVLATFNSIYSPYQVPIVVEAMALSKTLVLANELGFTKVIFEGDCLRVVQALSRLWPVYDVLFRIIFDIHKMLKKEATWKVLYAPRVFNRGANLLEKYVCSSKLYDI